MCGLDDREGRTRASTRHIPSDGREFIARVTSSSDDKTYDITIVHTTYIMYNDHYCNYYINKERNEKCRLYSKTRIIPDFKTRYLKH